MSLNSTILGHGSYGQVSISSQTPQIAIKRNMDPFFAAREMFFLKYCAHECIVDCTPIDSMTFAMHRYPQSLYTACCVGDPIPYDCARNIALDLASALAHMHALGVLHCDIKMNNVLITTETFDDQTRAVLCDFGLAEVVGTNAPRTRYSDPYRAPELGEISSATFASESWAFGCVLLFMACGDYKLIENIIERQKDGFSVAYYLQYTGDYYDDCDDQVYLNLIADCLSIDPEKRPSMDDIVARLGGPKTNHIRNPFPSQIDFRAKLWDLEPNGRTIRVANDIVFMTTEAAPCADFRPAMALLNRLA